MKIFVILMGLAVWNTSFAVDPLFDSSTQILLDGVISDGTLVSNSAAASYKSEIAEQIHFMVGQFNDVDGVAKVANPTIVINSVGAPDSSGWRTVHYSAKLGVAWNRNRSVPDHFDLIMPVRTNAIGLTNFLHTYANDCNNEDGDEITIDNYWYHYRPLASSCSLNTPDSDDPNLVARFPLQLKISGENTNGKFPEYGEIWKSGTLTVTIVMSKFAPGDTSDEGIDAFNDAYHSLIDELGDPAKINVSVTGDPGVDHPYLEMLFNLDGGRKLDLHLYLVDKPATAGADFIKRYQARTLVSDLILYSGHAGIGSNVRALANMGKYKKGKYQIFFVNGCDTFAYSDYTIFRAHALANPGSAPSRYLDLITNAMPAYFNSFGGTARILLRTMIDKKLTYKEMLSQIDSSQKVVVEGEEDNHWPAAF